MLKYTLYVDTIIRRMTFQILTLGVRLPILSKNSIRIIYPPPHL